MIVVTRYKNRLFKWGYRREFDSVDAFARAVQLTPLDVLYGGFDSDNGRRTLDSWRATYVVLADVDTPGGSTRPRLSAEQLAVLEQRMPLAFPTLWYPSPRGARAYFVLESPVFDLETARAVGRGAWAWLGRVLSGTDLTVDECTCRPVQIARGPGAERVRLLRYLWPAERLVALDPTEAALGTSARYVPREEGWEGDGEVWPVPEARPPVPPAPYIGMAAASTAWSTAHPVPDLGRPGTRWACPVCGSRSGFGRLGSKSASTRWVCFSSHHPPEVGRLLRSGGGYWGDVLDLVAWRERETPASYLIRSGWLSV